MTIIHGRQAHAKQTIWSNLTVFRATIRIHVDSEDKQIKQNAMESYTDIQIQNLLLNIFSLTAFNELLTASFS